LRRAEEKLAWKRLVKRYNENLKTRIQEATAELKKTYALQEKLLQSSLDGIIGTDEEGRIMVFNASAQQLSGYTTEEIQEPPRSLSDLIPEWGSFVRQALQPTDGGRNRTWSGAGRLRHKSGQEIPVRISGTLLIEGEKFIGSVGYLQDLREIERLQKELLRSERLAATGQTVAGLAHAIKNILGGLKGGRYMVNKGFELNEMKYLKEGWDMVERNIEKVSSLTRDLLNFCKDREPEREWVNPNGLIGEVFDLFRLRAEQVGVRMTLDLEKVMEPAHLDPKGIHEVLSNLVANALDACTLGETPVDNPEVVLKSRALPEDRILLEVRDNGMGMPPEICKKLFTIFFSTKGSRGTGLGLLLAQKIVKEHGGEISMQSTSGKGSIFQVILPLSGQPGGHQVLESVATS
jgi:PAS domain S-box-containing protein